MATATLTKDFTGTGQSEEFGPKPGLFCFDLSGSFDATLVLQRKAPGATDWITLSVAGSAVTFTGPASELIREVVEGARYRVSCTVYASGTASVRLQQ